MQQPQRSAPRLTLLLLLLVFCQGCSNLAGDVPADLSLFPESTWLYNAQAVREQLSTQPVECLGTDLPVTDRYQIEVGKAAFNTPLLLGGQAARMGISCNSCHRNGQGNPQFFIAGLSAEPGTLDVSHGFFSEVREDGIFNPVPIPNLLDVRDKRVFGTLLPQNTLQAFVHGVIVDEFAGPEPAPEIMEALLAYISALDSTACNSTDLAPRNLQTDLHFLEMVISSLNTAAEQGQEATIPVLVLAAQSRLQDIHTRFNGNSAIQQSLEDSSRGLRNILRSNQSEQISVLNMWKQTFTILRQQLVSTVNSSNYPHRKSIP